MTPTYAPPEVETVPTVIKTSGMRVPLKVWARDPEAGALEQATNLTRLPFALHHVALMPDAHQGYGMPIGGVLFADRAVVPYAVGVDIGCGVSLLETDLSTADGVDAAYVKKVLDQIARDVPVGNGPQGGHRQPDGEPMVVPDALREIPRLMDVINSADLQLGSLGGGNHFIELQESENGRVWVMLHSGSRSVGKKICDHWHVRAKDMNARWHSQVPHPELSYLPADSDEGRGYLAEMTLAMAWAEENRRRMAGKVISALGKSNVKAWQVLDVHHNYAAWENHFGKNGLVHRKGAVRAQSGEVVLIPGSMGTASYVAMGLGNPDSFMTCQHGAGRARSRGDTRRMTTVEKMEEQLKGAGVVLVTPNREAVIDESSVAYKDIKDVMVRSEDLVRPLRRHTPLGVLKG